MHNVDALYFFIFVFTVLVSLRHLLKFIVAMLEKTPKPLVYDNIKLISLGLSISYIITYIYLS